MNALSRGLAGLILRRITGPRLPPDRAVNPSRFGIRLKDPACLARCREVLTAFFSGFELGLKSPERLAEGHTMTDPLVRPFFHEGFAMGWLPRGYLELTGATRSLDRFEDAFSEADSFLFLRYVGLGFWLGFQHASAPDRVDSTVAQLSASKYGPLVHDGYGFKLGFFGHEQIVNGDTAAAVASLRRFQGFARESAMNGLGRSLWFFCMDHPDDGVALARKLGPDLGTVLGGMGLAAAFTFTDDLSRAYGVAERLPESERRHFSKGIRIALYVRASADEGHLHSLLDRHSPELRSLAERDLGMALKAGAETRHKGDFIEVFHKRCLEP